MNGNSFIAIRAPKETFENILASVYQYENCQVPIHRQHFFRHIGLIKEKRQQSTMIKINRVKSITELCSWTYPIKI